MMKLIVAVDRRGGIGKDGKLLVHLPGDMKYFKETTSGHTVIMGRKTFQSLPSSRPLPNRRNIIISKTLPLDYRDDVEVYRTPEQVVRMLSVNSDTDSFVIGGGTIYSAMLPFCNEAYVTEIDDVFDADTFIPIFSKLDDWECTYKSDTYEDNGTTYNFTVYRRKG